MKIVKIIVRIIGGFAALLLIVGLLSLVFRPGEMPSVEKAQWSIQTYTRDNASSALIPSRIYLAAEIEYKNGNVVLNNYWWYDGKRWMHSKKPRELKGLVVEVKKRNVNDVR